MRGFFAALRMTARTGNGKNNGKNKSNGKNNGKCGGSSLRSE
jgi:hypothetical protein